MESYVFLALTLTTKTQEANSVNNKNPRSKKTDMREEKLPKLLWATYSLSSSFTLTLTDFQHIKRGKATERVKQREREGRSTLCQQVYQFATQPWLICVFLDVG